VQASVELRDFNPGIGKCFFFKSQYWSGREGWSKEEIREANIRPEKILDDAKSLIRG
jgi:hypothetical protein